MRNILTSRIQITYYPGFDPKVSSPRVDTPSLDAPSLDAPSVRSREVYAPKEINNPREDEASKDLSSTGIIESEKKFIDELRKKNPSYPNLNLFLIKLEKGLVRVNFIANMVKENQKTMDKAFRTLVEKGVTDPKYDGDVKSLIDDFINPASNFNIVKDCSGNNHIFNATRHGKVELVRAILERDPDSVNIVSTLNRNSLLHVAIANNLTNVVKELLTFSKLNLYLPCGKIILNKVQYNDKNVFEIASLVKNYTIMKILEVEHKKRLDSKDSDAIAFQSAFPINFSSTNPTLSDRRQKTKKYSRPSDLNNNPITSAHGCYDSFLGQQLQNSIGNGEGPYSHFMICNDQYYGFHPNHPHNLNPTNFQSSIPEMASPLINSYAPQASSQLYAKSPMVWVDPRHLQYYSYNIHPSVSEMASPLINPYAPQASSQLNAESPMVWDDPEHLQHYSYNIHPSFSEMANMSMAGARSENGMSVSRPPVIPDNPETTSLSQIINLISKNHEVRNPQPISASIDLTISSQSAFTPVRKKRRLDDLAQEKSSESANTLPKDRQSIDNGGRITSTSASPIIQKSPSKLSGSR